MRNSSDIICRGNQKTHFMFNKLIFENRARFLDVEKYGRARQDTGDNIIERTRLACCITEATNPHTKYVILIPFPGQQWLRKRASILRFYYIAYPSYYYTNISNNHGYAKTNTATNETSFLTYIMFL
jgi:hypothetical protein